MLVLCISVPVVGQQECTCFYHGVECENYICICNLVEIKTNHGCILADLGDSMRVFA